MKNKLYIVYYEWPNTAGNHAGMAHLFRFLCRKHKNDIKLIQIPTALPRKNKYVQKMYLYALTLYFFVFAKRIFLTEYLGNRSGNQTWIANRLRRWKWSGTLLGLVHLSEKHLCELYDSEIVPYDLYVSSQLKLLDKVLVFGSSLANFFIRLGHKDKVVLTYHYVDTSYYHALPNAQSNSRLQVIAMGSLKRNYADLEYIVKQLPEIDFNICVGNKDIGNLFTNTNNAKIYRFIPESELLSLMQNSDVSISVLEDTIGSNVITTSMACGLAQIVSDVGSIRDYLNDSNSILCDELESFVDALRRLNEDRNLLSRLKQNAIHKAEKISIVAFDDWFQKEVL